MSNTTESVIFTLKFSTDYKVNPPVIEVKHNDSVVIGPTIIDGSTKIEFTLDLPVNSVTPCKLEIIRSGFDGVNNQLLNLDEVWIDDVNITKLNHLSRYYPVYPEPWFSEQLQQGNSWPEFHYGWTSWGWNGCWVLDCETPIYTWLLKNV